jgi:steroid 5-alpha reductase family enzyme
LILHKYIRAIFSVFALLMIGVFAYRVYAGEWAALNWLMLGVAALSTVLVFRCFVYIFNYSYGLACIGNGGLIAVAFANPAGWVLGGLLALYGLRLFAFTWRRMRSDSYAGRMVNVREADAALPTPVKAALWLQCTFLYTFHLLGLYAAAAHGVLTAAGWAGAGIILLGIVIEAVADAQKQAGKTRQPDAFVTQGLYTRWRHPNYVGEILVQVGIMVAGAAAVWPDVVLLVGVWLAPGYIILLMVAECYRADHYMEERYGAQPEFQAYRARSGSLLPRM